MAIAHVGSEVQDVTSADPKTITSASTNTGHVLYMVQFASVVSSLTAGWTSIVADVSGLGGNHMRTSCRVSDAAANYSVTCNSVANNVAMDAFSGANTSSLFEQASSAVNTTTVPSVTPSVDNAVQIIVYGSDNSDGTVTTAPSGGGTVTLLGILDHHLVFGSCAVYMRAFGAGTAGIAQTSPTGIVWGNTGTNREITTFVIDTPGAAPVISGAKKLMIGLFL